MNAELQAVLFNAVPLALLAAASLVAGAARTRDRRDGGSRLDPAAAVLLGAGAAAVLLAVAVLVEREPLAGGVWVGLAATLAAAAPFLLLLRPGAPVDAPGAHEPPAEPLAARLAAEDEPEAIGRILADTVVARYDLDLAELALVTDDRRAAHVVAARQDGADVDWLKGLRLDLEGEPTGIGVVLRDPVPFAVFDAASSAAISKRINQRAGMKSCAFVPVLAGAEAVGVLVVATKTPRVFTGEQLVAIQALAADAGVALARASSAAALGDALERERLGARIALEARSRSELDEVVAIACAEAGRAIGCSRCFVVLGETGAAANVVAEWDADGVERLPDTVRLPVVALAMRERRTVAVRDVERADELRDAELGDVDEVLRVGTRAVLAVPLVALERVVGVLAFHRAEPSTWAPGEVLLAEAVARAVAGAIHADRLAVAGERRSSARGETESGFFRVASVLSEPLSSAATLDAVAHAAGGALGGAAVAVLQASGGTLELAASHDLPEPLRALLAAPDGPELGTAARAGKVLASRDLARETRFGAALADAAAEAGMHSLLAVPLTQPRTEGNGIVLVFFEEERTFTDDELKLAGHVAAAARGALERSELYELERRARALAQRLASSGREIAAELDPENVLDAAARGAVGLVDAAAAAVWVLEGDELVVHAACGEGASAAIEARRPSTAWLLGDIVQSRNPTTIENATGDERAAEADPMIAAGHLSYVGVPMIGPDGSVHGVLGVYGRVPRDWREEEREALAALAGTAAAARANAEHYQGVRHEQQRSEAILVNVADGIVAVDRDGRVVRWNPAAEQITGVGAAEALGRTPAQVLGRSLESEGAPAGSSRLVPIRRGSEEVWLSLSEAVMTDPAGAIAGRIFAFRDISAERAVEQMKSDFVSTVSHELRTPLTSIYGFAETLLRQDVLFGEAERETFLRYIASESERLTAIVDRLLSVAQLDSGAMSVLVAETDVGAVVTEAVRAQETAADGNGHRFVVALDDGPLAAAADREKLGQVLAHLLDNAVRYSPVGGTVTVGARRSDSVVEVRVEDEGAGIPRAEQERIFRKFYRGESASRTVGAGATGLGLFLAEGLVTAMGGRIWVDSDEGRGATFVIELQASPGV